MATPILWIAICGEDAYRQKKIVVRMRSDKKKDKKKDKNAYQTIVVRTRSDKKTRPTGPKSRALG